jgi:CheY-like chemotaxis protein
VTPFSLTKEERPALVVLDRMLPGIDGEEVLAQLRNDPSARDVP